MHLRFSSSLTCSPSKTLPNISWTNTMPLVWRCYWCRRHCNHPPNFYNYDECHDLIMIINVGQTSGIVFVQEMLGRVLDGEHVNDDENLRCMIVLMKMIWLMWPFLSDPGKPGVRSLGPDVCPSLSEWVSEWDTLLRLNWCDSGWWRYQVNTNW